MKDEHKDVQEQASAQTPPGDPQGWEEVAEGRFMPRRTRGSCRGLALG